MKTTTYKLKITLMTPILGSQPSDPEIASTHIAKRKGLDALPSQEDELLPEAIEKGTTVFYRDSNGDPCLMSYQLLGALKEAGKVMNGRAGDGVKALRSKVEARVFISPRVLKLRLPEGGELEYLERPLRAETAMGPRVALARSEMLPEGTWFECGVEVLDGDISEDVLRDLLDYGYYRGLGQWRNSGNFGTYRYELTRED